MALSPKVYQFLVCVFASIGSLLYGYDLGVIASAIASPDFISKFGDDSKEMYVHYIHLHLRRGRQTQLTITKRSCRISLYRRSLRRRRTRWSYQ